MQNFRDMQGPPITAAWLNEVDQMLQVFGGIQNLAQLAATLGLTGGVSVTVALPPATSGGTAGELTVTNGIVTAYTAPT